MTYIQFIEEYEIRKNVEIYLYYYRHTVLSRSTEIENYAYCSRTNVPVDKVGTWIDKYSHHNSFINRIVHQ